MNTQRETFKDKPIYSLTDISQSLHSVIAKNYPRPYYIKAEIVRLNYYPHSGHCYPELAEKEGNVVKTQMRAIIWASAFREINARFKQITGEPMKEGINILCLATIEYDVKYGLSLHIQNVEPTYTLGDMVKNKLLVIERLKKEGVFTANKEKKLPLIPKHIAVISVETSKGYADFMVTLANNRYNYKFECTLFPSILQGEKAIRTINEKLTEIENARNKFDCV
ncbi:exodeoxyribonuclease VII large subunit, partial [Bacteroidales bacterium OttesenSCG-928-E04]|nr:exodeoxyribonuclease VII large subunit [Bacteroidales bacterium OttesenSCG-928-E04]